jgi:hypothetical protein
MEEPQQSGMPKELPAWFLQYIHEQQNQSVTAQENERQRIADEEKKVNETRLRMVRNDNKPGKALPPLLEFYGDSDKLEAWLQQARAKIEVDYYGCTEYVKFWALNGSLRGKALRRMEAWVREQGKPELASGSNFLDRVEFVFRDPQAKERAQRTMEGLCQGSRPFLEVFTEWQALLMESGGGSWPDDAKKVSLDRILSDELVKEMITVPSQPDFESYCSIIKETDDRLRAYKARTSRPRNQSSLGTPQTSWKQSTDAIRRRADDKVTNNWKVTRKASVEDMDWEPAPAKVLTTNTKRAKWVSQEERGNRLRTGRCVCCGATGHFARACPYEPARRPVTANTARKPRVEIKEVAPELEEEELSSDSEN